MNVNDFILARITEDEEVARSARPHEYLTTRDDAALGTVDQGGYETCTITSGRALAECEAKRRIVAAHHLTEHGECETCDVDQETGTGWRDGPCNTLRALAAIHANHPDYTTVWEPDQD